MLLLVLFILIIGTATFIENYYDTPTAQQLIYNAKWFEFLIGILVIQFFGNQLIKKNFTKDKLPQLLFHTSFLLIIIGGGVTRYFGYEGNMHILENEEVNVVYTVKPYLQVRNTNKLLDYKSDQPLLFSQLSSNDFELDFNISENEKLIITYRDFIYNARELYLATYKDSGNDHHHLDRNNPNQQFPNALLVTVTYNSEHYDIVLFHDELRYIQSFNSYTFGELELEMVYGPKPIILPFSVQLEDFNLIKYPGTEIPSASESKVLLIDERNGLKEEKLIAKNKILDYDGYRFFQTSYDDDENGTILTVNFDYYGTRITYLGYFLMALGALLILLSKKSQFSQLDTKIKQVRAQRKSLLMTLILFAGIQGVGFSQQDVQNPISKEHADRFGQLLVQTYDGRFASVHSLATDVIHKITGKDDFDFPGKGNMDLMHLFLDMHVDPNFWVQQNLIVVREKKLGELLGINQKYVPFAMFFNTDKSYRLDGAVKKAYQKKAADQSALEREIIKVTERVNIFSMILNGSLLKIFPVQNSENNRWVSWNEELAFEPLKEPLLLLNEDLKLQEFTYSNIMRSYFISTIYARESNDYKIPNKIMGYISSMQRQLTPPKLLPSKSKIKLEVFYNSAKIFDFLKYVFGILGILLLALSISDNFMRIPDKKIKLGIKIIIALFIVAFSYQTFGMGLRWYLGGHAPWSNGYEVLLLVAWGGILAGLYVIRYSKITLAATALLAFLILMTAGHSYYDPQLTNLNPVLKSYWLIIHVAIVTIGYGFLGLSFLLGLITLFIQLFKSIKKPELSNLIIMELTLTNEKLVTIGMYLTAIGTFIGCMWANESWGNYWSWNAKQVWSLIIVLIYGVILHFKYIPGMKSPLAFNIAALISFGSVLMTFIGVNYYFTKGLHTYASDDPPIFPVWAWCAIIALFLLIVAAIFKEKKMNKKNFKTSGLGLLLVGLMFINYSCVSETKTVLFDEAHGQLFKVDDSKDLGLSKLSSIFKNKNWTIKTSNTEITDELLNGIDALVISGAFKPVNKSETMAIMRFLEGGGKLSVMLHIGPPVSDLLHTLEVSISNGVLHETGDLVLKNDIDFTIRDLKDHELTKDLKEFNIYGGWALLPTENHNYAIAQTSENAWIDLNGDKLADAQQKFAAVVVGAIGKGEFVVFSDDAIFQNNFLVGHNYSLGENLERWFAN